MGWEPLFCLGLGHHHGHLTVVFARRPHSYFNVLAESGEEVNKAAYREVARTIARQRRDMGLRNAEDFPSFGLGDAAVRDDAVDLQSQARLQKFLVSVGQAEVISGVSCTDSR